MKITWVWAGLVVLSSGTLRGVDGPGVRIERRISVCKGGHAPKAARLDRKHMILAARTGLRGTSANSSVSIAESTDGGRSWSPPRLLWDSPKDDRVQSLSVLPDGSLLLAFIQEGAGRAEAFLMRSRDRGKTWSDPERLDPSPYDYVYPYGRAMGGEAGELLLTAYCGYYPLYDNRGKPPEKQDFSSNFFASRDGGKSWAFSRLIARSTSQPSVIRLSSGRLLAALRSAKVFTSASYQKLMQSPTEYVKVPDQVLMSESTDLGRTWSSLRLVTRPGELQGSLAQAPSGEVVMTYSVRHKPYGVALMTSKDEGRTWSRPFTLVQDAPSPDVGLTQTLEVEANRFVTFYYSENTATRESEVFAVFWTLGA
jgi:photosystem II stability/assembly factor-like uncharacterized protein